MVGPNTHFPLTAFSKKETATAMSSTEAEVISANLAIPTVGLPSSCLWQVIRQAGGVTNAKEKSLAVGRCAQKNTKTDFSRSFDAMLNPNIHFLTPETVLSITSSAQSITVAQYKDGAIDADVSWDWSSGYSKRG